MLTNAVDPNKLEKFAGSIFLEGKLPKIEYNIDKLGRETGDGVHCEQAEN